MINDLSMYAVNLLWQELTIYEWYPVMAIVVVSQTRQLALVDRCGAKASMSHCAMTKLNDTFLATQGQVRQSTHSDQELASRLGSRKDACRRCKQLVPFSQASEVQC